MKKIKVSQEKPPKWLLDEVKEKFNVEWNSAVIFTYGGEIKSSYGFISEDLFIHESEHIRQQDEFGGTDKWWKKYLSDEEFRYEQELEAYQKQWEWAKLNCSNGKMLEILQACATSLSSEMYGELVDYEKAIKQIQE